MPHHQRKAVPTESLDPALTEVSRQVIGASIEIHRALGPGFSRAVYVGALTSELDAAGIPYVVDFEFPVTYKGQKVGVSKVGLYVNNRFAVEPMAEHREIDGVDRTALRAKLRAADLELGLIINFGERRLKDGLVRVLNPDKLEAQAAAGADAPADTTAGDAG
ncbi:MAG: GxxExxY protein [Planctomycetota bacterium]|nr:MAG: GxxExxY protein [Planctomycetota bacterium]